MRPPNYRQAKKQKEEARKNRQAEKQQRRSERTAVPAADEAPQPEPARKDA